MTTVYKCPRCGATNSAEPALVSHLTCHYCARLFLLATAEVVARVIRLRA